MGDDNAVQHRNPAEEARKDLGEEVAKALPDEATLNKPAADEEPPGEDTGSPAGRGGDVDWSASDIRPERTPSDPKAGRD